MSQNNIGWDLGCGDRCTAVYMEVKPDGVIEVQDIVTDDPRQELHRLGELGSIDGVRIVRTPITLEELRNRARARWKCFEMDLAHLDAQLRRKAKAFADRPKPASPMEQLRANVLGKKGRW